VAFVHTIALRNYLWDSFVTAFLHKKHTYSQEDSASIQANNERTICFSFWFSVLLYYSFCDSYFLLLCIYCIS